MEVELPQLLTDLATAAVSLVTIVIAAWLAIRRALGQAGAQANGKIRELAGEDVVQEWADHQTPNPDEPEPDRPSTGLIGLAVRRELRPIVEEQKRQGQQLAEQGRILDLLIEESDALTERSREHSDEIRSLKDTLDDEEAA